MNEANEPLPHISPQGFVNTVLFNLRLFFDLQVCTVYGDIKKFLKNAGDPILEVGCGLQPYRHLIPKDVAYIAIDWKGADAAFHYKNADTLYFDGGAFPFPDESFNCIFHTEVLEHIYELNQFLSECHRVVVKGGKMFFSIPFSARNHYIPHDYWRLTPACIHKLLNHAGFDSIVIKPRGDDIVVALAKLDTIILRIIMRTHANKVVQIFRRIIFGSMLALPFLCLTLFAHIFLLLKAGSIDDPLGYSVCCEK